MTIETMEENQKKITIADVADALGVSKTTVSRAISGKGRIGKETRERVLQYIEEHDYTPNVIARGLAKSKTFNIALVMPGNYNFLDSSFLQKCMLGISEAAAMEDYDMIVSMIKEDDITRLERLVMNNKVDGIILGRTLEKDLPAEYLKKKNVPFVVIGTSTERGIVQVDHDHREACKELTSILLMKGMRRIALIGGNKGVVITGKRYQGYADAFEDQEVEMDHDLVYLDAEHSPMLEKAVLEILHKKAQCIICMDDSICYQVLNVLKDYNVRVPDDVRIASFYNSTLLENNVPAITSLQFDETELGMVACRTLLDYIDGHDVRERTLLGYEVVLKESTK